MKPILQATVPLLEHVWPFPRRPSNCDSPWFPQIRIWGSSGCRTLSYLLAILNILWSVAHRILSRHADVNCCDAGKELWPIEKIIQGSWLGWNTGFIRKMRCKAKREVIGRFSQSIVLGKSLISELLARSFISCTIYPSIPPNWLSSSCWVCGRAAE
jgi:hypothetical protein